MSDEHVDVLIVGAGLSGIGAACRLQQRARTRRSRSSRRAERSAGRGTCSASRASARTRTCSRSATRSARGRGAAIVDGASILDYVRETAREHGIDQQDPLPPPRRRGRVVVATTRAGPSSVERTDTGETVAADLRLPVHVHRLLPLRRGLHAGVRRASSASAGEIVHPQFWPEDVDYAGKRVVVIGSGATAVTLVPALAERAAHVTMLQRSPSYVISLPARRPDRRPARARPARPARLSDRALEEHPAARSRSTAQPPPARRRCEAAHPPAARAPAAAPASTSTRTSTPATSRGTSACASCPTATCSRRSAPAASRSSPTASRRSRRRASRSRPGPSSRPT